MIGRIEWRGATYHTDGTTLALMGQDGRSWYHEAGASLRLYASRMGFAPQRVADILAILSPRVSVARNVAMTRHYLETGSFLLGTMSARRRAVEQYESTGVFTGPKVNAFSAALLGDPDAVVVDAWLYRALGDHRTPGARHYRDVAERVRSVADTLNWTPAETQAAIWTGTRELVGFHDRDGALSFQRVSI